MPRTYTLTRIGSLLLTRAAVSGPAGTKILNLLIDTGSSYTILPVEVLESVGFSAVKSAQHERIATGSGYIIAPKLTVTSLNTCGRTFREAVVIGHTLPFGSMIDGLLGMDLLCGLNAKISVAVGRLEVT